MQDIQMNGESRDLTQDNIDKLKEIFPEVFNENKIDFDKLQVVLGENIDTVDEKYRFTWNGKMDSLRLSQSPSMGTLRPCKEDSKDWDNTKNLYIEGDNLEVLKLLQNSYLNKINMIYIDPPYNTGNDFVYKDDFKDNIENYKIQTGLVDSEGNSTTTNSDGNGRYHTNWLNMMYPRLRLARNLLSDDGVIFISIDDNEISNLKKICDEIFGEENFIDILMVEMSNTGGMKVGAAKTGTITKNGEYVILYAKSNNYKQTERTALYDYVPGFDTHFNLFLSPDKNILKFDSVLSENQTIVDEFKRFGIDKNQISLKKYADYFEKSEVLQKFAFDNAERIVRPRTEVPTIPSDVAIQQNKWTKFDTDKRSESYYLTLNENNTVIQLVPMSYNYRDTDDFKSKYGRSVIRGDYWKGFWLDMGNVAKEGGVEYKNGKKPTRLIRQLAKWAITSNKNALVLDFFAGSATTAHAIIQQNLIDNGHRRFILVQLPEKVSDNVKEQKETYAFLKSIGKPPILSELGKERIRRVGAKIEEEFNSNNSQLKIGEQNNKSIPDVGFKVFKLDSSNIRKWNPDTKDLEQSLFDQINNFVEGRNELDALYEIILKCGLELTVPVEELNICGKKVYSVGYGALIACLDNNITLDVANEIAKIDSEFVDKQNVTVVFKDNGFANDSVKTNIKETMRAFGIGKFITV